jgi:alpha-amylase
LSPTIWYSLPPGSRTLLTAQGYDGPGDSVDYSVFNPFSSSSYFNPFCFIENYDNQDNVEQCWLGDSKVPLPDLDTSRTDVQNIWYDWVSGLVSNYSGESTLDIAT